MLFILSVLFVASLFVYAYSVIANFERQLPLKTNSTLILIAHPDDECMFFGPTIASLKSRSKARLHVLCLSTGNADGLGATRKKELTRSCQVFGIPGSNVQVLDIPELQDGMKNTWSPDMIAASLKNYVTKNKIDTIITFDEYGISGHPNHIAAYHGAKQFVDHQARDVRLYKLKSIRLPRKYIGVVDLLTIELEKRLWPDATIAEFVSSPGTYLVTHKAMRQHESQLIWFRWLYVTFSRYMFVNQLVPVV
ncbi:putative N-acetylglucosaminyl-phosphatidylinositol de-N-acetylase [Dichotomocladium elegans]|nr:putative N-acetylglucosaminyl-phosphatidylinositol de-N-acetylase [Dichotomocladium elegans]